MVEEEYAMMRYRRRTYGGQLTVTLRELAFAAHCHPDLVRQFADYGVVEPQESHDNETLFAAEAVERLRRGLRLRRDLHIGVSALPLVLDLLERIDALEAELDRLKRQAGR